MPEPQPLVADLVPHLTGALDGRLITPGDADYDPARTIQSGNYDRHPGLIVRPASDADVIRVVDLVRESGVPLAVRSGGHSFAGHSSIDDAVVLDLSDLNKIDIDAPNRIAWAQGGVSAGQYTAAAAEHGLATGFGDTASVGVAGITLAGGAGYLSRKYGLTVDEVLAAEIVTADGRLLQVDADNHPELFWGIRGGGGNFGVVTRIKYRLRDVTEFTGGMLVLPGTPEVLTGFLAAADAAPDELSTIMMAMVAPPMPFLPAEAHGRLIVLGLLGFAGPAAAADQALAPFRALATPLADLVKPSAYRDMFPPESDEDFRPRSFLRSQFAETLDSTSAEVVLEQLRTSTAMMSAVQFRMLGGAIARVPADATAFAHRQRKMIVNVATMYQQPAEATEREAWVTKLAQVLDQGPGVYTGFLGDEGPERVREAYPGSTWDRLVAVKRQYDSTNLFRSNHNIPVD